MQTREAPTLGIRSQKQLPQVFGYRHGRKNRHIGATRVPTGTRFISEANQPPCA